MRTRAGMVSGFNPTLVRLRRKAEGLAENQAREFQSHAGSIEAAWSHLSSPQFDKFQSHAGSIEASPSAGEGQSCPHVSIPRWFD